MHVLICGGGIVGASIAYFLGRRGVASTVIERSGLACATGHGVWGILNAPATGEVMAELIVGGRADTVPLAAFDPARFNA